MPADTHENAAVPTDTPNTPNPAESSSNDNVESTIPTSPLSDELVPRPADALTEALAGVTADELAPQPAEDVMPSMGATDPEGGDVVPQFADAYVSEEPEDDDDEYEVIEEVEVPIEFTFDLATGEALTFTDLEAGRTDVFESTRKRDHFADLVNGMSTSGTEGRRRGFGLWILADYERCVEELKAFESDTSDAESVTAAFTRARALMALGRPTEAAAVFQRVTDAHASHPRPRAGLIEAEFTAALQAAPDAQETVAADIEAKVHAAPGGFADTFEGRYLLGRAAELTRNWESALDHYAAAREADPDNRDLLKRFGHLAERTGLDEIALSCYEHLVVLGSTDKHVLLNLGVLYEDIGRDGDAAVCFDTVLHNDATNLHARLYLADAHAGMEMFYDEDLEKKEDRLNQILRIPITDFELSVRARNCLNKMEITTLGDLVRRTEQELLAYKNFGETSLTEIKEILHSKGLRLGMPREEAVASIDAHANRSASNDRSNVLNKPILELQLSIRARRTVETLGCLTLGDVMKHSAEELLGMPNFGQTSLQELRSKLGELGLKLKGD